MQTFTISRKIALGFSALILITGGLGGLAVTNMRSVRTASHTLATEYVPEVDLAGNLQRHLAAAQLAVRSYGFTAETHYLDETRQQLAAFRDDLSQARQLSEEHPNLVLLRESLGPLTAATQAYQAAVDATEARNTELSSARVKLDEAAIGFTTAIQRLTEGQQAKLEGEIKAGGAAADLLVRVHKLQLAVEIRQLGNTARIAAFKAQALRTPAIFQDSLKCFEPIEKSFTELLGLLKVQADIDDLNLVKRDAFAYRDAVKVVMNDYLELATIGQRRLEAADKLLSLATETQQIGMKRTVDAADSSDRRLALSSTTIIVGVGVALALGFAIAWIIIRGTTKVLTSVADSLGETSMQVTAAASQVASASQTLAEGATEQAASIEETSASLEEMSSMTKRNAEGAQQAKDLSHLTRTSADAGADHMREMRQAMDAIKSSSDDIAKIIKTIDEIAFQTNILALNAAVEAARAGEAGMGFAVVAEEVRALAQRSAQSAKETATKIEDAIRKSEHGVTISAKVAASLSDILEKARKMDSLIGEIATASSEQSQGIHQVNSAVAQMDKVTQSNASGAEESAAAAEELNAQAAAMQRSVADLRRLLTPTTSENDARLHAPAARHRPAPSQSAGVSEPVFADAATFEN